MIYCRLTVTEKLGDMIADHCKGKNRTYLDMAETIFRNCYAHHKVVNVMVRQGLNQRALDYAKDKDFTTSDYIGKLVCCVVIYGWMLLFVVYSLVSQCYF